MNQFPIRTVFAFVEYFGLRIEFRDDLPAHNAGYLDPHEEPQYIAINRNLPICEQEFTAAHELCHCISQHNRPRRKYRHRLLDRQYKSKAAQTMLSYQRHIVNRMIPMETEADMVAMSAMLQYAPPSHLLEFLRRHPEKKWLCLYVTADFLIRLPFRLMKAIFTRLLYARAEP